MSYRILAGEEATVALRRIAHEQVEAAIREIEGDDRGGAR